MNTSARSWAATIRDSIEERVASPLRISRLEVLELDSTLLIRITAADGTVAYAPANGRVRDTLSLIERRVFPFFIGRDACDIAWLAELCFASNSNYKYAGVGLWNAIAHVELAALDLVGRQGSFGVAELFGGARLDKVDVYLSSTTRASEPREELELIARRLAETGARACKFKIGGRMAGDEEGYPDRTRILVEEARQRLGAGPAIYVDANSSYSVDEALEIGRMLEANGIDLYEEPVHFQDFEGTKQIADSLAMDVSGGEQCADEYLFRWMFAHHGVDVVQPDVYYAGGLSRTLRIARMAEEAGFPVTPHSPRTDFQQTPNLHFISLLDRPGRYHEHHIKPVRTHAWVEPEPDLVDGSVAVPDGPGLGLEYDENALAGAEVVLRMEETK